jgi:hypothetical protein
MKKFLLITGCLLVTACSAEPGSAKWCAAKTDQPKSEWSMADVGTYTQNCLIDGTAVGSDNWCDNMSDKPKGDWTADDTASYAKHCVL